MGQIITGKQSAP